MESPEASNQVQGQGQQQKAHSGCNQAQSTGKQLHRQRGRLYRAEKGNDSPYKPPEETGYSSHQQREQNAPDCNINAQKGT
jgi:hypothetical protein